MNASVARIVKRGSVNPDTRAEWIAFMQGYKHACQEQMDALEDLYQEKSRDADFYEALERAIESARTDRQEAIQVLTELEEMT